MSSLGQMERAALLISDARIFRSRAEEMRTAAESMLDDYCRQASLRLADDWDRITPRTEPA